MNAARLAELRAILHTRIPNKPRTYNVHPTLSTLSMLNDRPRMRRFGAALGSLDRAEIGTMLETVNSEYSALLNAAAMETWNRSWSMSDYQISAIGSKEFPEEQKTTLRENRRLAAYLGDLFQYAQMRK